MVIDNESWNKVEKILKEMNSEYTSLDKINNILYLITRDSDQLINSFIEQVRTNEIKLIRDIMSTLNITSFLTINLKMKYVKSGREF